MIEADRPTIATFLRQQGYHTAIVGKWHVGLRYRQTDGSPAAGWQDADLQQPMIDTPLDHGFDFCRITSRSHGTSGPGGSRKRANRPNQTVGPGHIHGRTIIGATDRQKQLVSDGPSAYVLRELGGRHSDSAIEFIESHLNDEQTAGKPFFLYYPSNSNHAPYTPDSHVGDAAVAGAARNVAGQPMNVRSDFVYENDVALGRLLDYLANKKSADQPEQTLLHNTIVIFTSDNGAEIQDKTATGPFRSNKGSVYEGGHRVPFIVSWPAGGIGDGDETTAGRTSSGLMGLQDLFATFAEILEVDLPDLKAGERGAEDSVSALAAWRNQPAPSRPLLFHDHKEAQDHAAAAIRFDSPVIDGQSFPGQWKLLLDAGLLRQNQVNPSELYDLKTDPREQNNRLEDPQLQPLVQYLGRMAYQHRTAGGHRWVDLRHPEVHRLNWATERAFRMLDDHSVRNHNLTRRFHNQDAAGVEFNLADGMAIHVRALRDRESVKDTRFTVTNEGLGVTGGQTAKVDDGEGLAVTFNRDVYIEALEIVAGDEVCGGFYQVADHAPLAVYCVDADIDAQDQSGLLTDVGTIRAGQTLLISSSPHLGVESAGRWRLRSLRYRQLANRKVESSAIKPLPHAHAHNDYRHTRPLHDALAEGFTSVEADIFLVGDQLLIGHDLRELHPERTLTKLYLQPLSSLAQQNGGSIYGRGGEFTLMIDIKSDGTKTFQALHTELQKFASTLTRVQQGRLRRGAVTVIVSGNRDRDTIADSEPRLVGIDGRLGDLESTQPAHLLPLISDRWTSHFRWTGAGPMPEAERKKLRDIVARAHASHRRVRFWATPESERVWAELLAAGVDLINTDDLKRLNRFLNRQPTGR